MDVSFLILSIFNQTNLAQNEGTCFGNVTEGEGTASVSSCLLLHVSVRDLVLFFSFFWNFQLRLTNINFDFCSLLLLPAVFLGISALVALIVVFLHFVSV